MDYMTQQANNSTVEVEIFGQKYILRGSDPDYILKLVAYLDSRMRALADGTHTGDGEQLAVLTALRIAAEYDLLRRKLDGRSSILPCRNTPRSGTGGRKGCPKVKRGKSLAKRYA